MIECENVIVGYGKKEVARSVSLKAESGKITVLLGRNGCGKTTLLRAVGGSIGYGGSIRLDGAEVRMLSASARSRLVSVMPQMLRSPDITVRELVSFGRQPYTGFTGVLSAKDRELVENVLDKTGLTVLAEKRLSCISGGERQKAYFALLLSQKTQNLLLDEPGSQLDAAYMNQLTEFLTEEKNSGKTILAVLHDINRTIELADKIIVLQNGGVAFDGNSRDFCGGNIAETVFGLKKYRCTDPANPQSEKICYL